MRDHYLFDMPGSTSLAWRPGRLIVFAMSLMIGCYMVAFMTESRPSLSMFRDAIANTAAAAIAAGPVWLLCTRAPWRFGNRWWFLPIHVAGVAAFIGLWYVAIAYALGLSSAIAGGQATPSFLVGPALRWEAMTAVVLYFAIAAACYTTQATRDAQRSAALLHEAEVSALRAQLDPHLLFNTLHSLLELVRSGDARADDAIDRFARVTRYVSQGRSPGQDLVPLSAEWTMVQDYVALESLRLGARLICQFQLGPDLDAVMIPALSLQPLVENAIRHGIAPRPGPGHITVTAERRDRLVMLDVVDDGLGGGATTTRGSGTGLDLVRRRLQAHYGTSLQFTAGPSSSDVGWSVHACFPALPAA